MARFAFGGKWEPASGRALGEEARIAEQRGQRDGAEAAAGLGEELAAVHRRSLPPEHQRSLLVVTC